MRGLDPRTYPLRRRNAVTAPVRPFRVVMRGFMPRIYPSRSLDVVAAPLRVGPRVKPEGDDSKRSSHPPDDT